ncbi:MAG: zf-HC2 domain-containing protein [bacterium]|jgi:hypothetical protein|nr:zf-HC2 domain-containing protein [bacterium]
MFCEKFAEWGILYLYDELEPEARHEFETHLKLCQQCQGELALLKEGKLFARMLPLEEMAPISYEEIVPSLKPAQGIFEKYVQPFGNSIRSIFQDKRRLVLVPVGVAFLLLMMFYLFNPQLKIFKSSDSPYSETVLDWEVGLGESLDNLDQKIAQLKSENLVVTKTSWDSTLYSEVDYFSDQHINQIKADIQSLTNELSHLNF